MPTIVITFERERRSGDRTSYRPVGDAAAIVVSGRLYLDEDALIELGDPDRLRLHLVPGDPEGDGHPRRIDFLRAVARLEPEQPLAA